MVSNILLMMDSERSEIPFVTTLWRRAMPIQQEQRAGSVCGGLFGAGSGRQDIAAASCGCSAVGTACSG